MTLFYDTETVGLYGMPVLLQYAIDDNDIILYDLWKHPIIDTLKLIEWMMSQDVCGFNLAFDHFMLLKLYTTFSLFPDSWALPEDHIEELAILEEKARFSPLVIKPKRAMDLMLFARKGPFQSLMPRDEIRIKRIPAILSEMLKNELERRMKIDPVYFAKNPRGPYWKIFDCVDKQGHNDKKFKDIVLRFSASGKLKALAKHALGIKDVLLYGDIEVDDTWRPVELGYAPYALAIGRPGRWKWTWPEVIQRHINHWAFHNTARQYASDDVKYTRDLYKYFNSPEPGDDDSELAICVACCRWRGYAIDINKIKEERKKTIELTTIAPKAPHKAKEYIAAVMTEEEQEALFEGTKKVVLEAIAKWQQVCPKCNGSGCSVCDNGLIIHPAAERAANVLTSRKATKKIELLDKLIQAGRFHASFVVIGTKSSRMAGSDDLNPQGIDRTKQIRSCFDLKDPEWILSGGDFDAFEVVLADAAWDDPQLRADLQAGKKIHALFAQELHPGMSYQDVLATKGSSKDLYSEGKQGVFSQIYGGDFNTLVKKLGIGTEDAMQAAENWAKRYRKMAASRQTIFNMFCSMRQPKGIGQAVEWHKPSDFIESLFGFRRYFNLENELCKTLFDLANKPPSSWKNIHIKVIRRDREQTASGAVQSALYAAAFAIQAANMRAAANHVIQSSGAQITKRVQRKIWDLQPPGINEWQVAPMNIHDEILAPSRPELVNVIKETVEEAVESFRSQVPLIKMDWKIGMNNWGEK